MSRLAAAALPRLRLRAFKHGVVDGNSRWLAVWGALAAARLLKRLMRPKPVVERFALQPGQTLVITDLGESEPGPAAS